MKQHPIFQKANIWHRELINRTVVAPMSRVSATADGLATDEMTDYFPHLLPEDLQYTKNHQETKS